MSFRQKMRFTAMVLGIVLFLLLVFSVFPLFHSIRRDSAQLASLQNTLFRLSSQDTKTKRFEGLKLVHEAHLQQLDSLFIDARTPIEFIEFLESLGTELEIPLQIAPGDLAKEQENEWPSLYFRVSSQGSYPAFEAFLKKLEGAPYLLEVKNTTMNSLRKDTAPSEKIQFTLSLKVFAK